MGALSVGDYVFDADGRPVRVTALSAIESNPDAWELTFDDGTSIECDADHQWVTLTAAERAGLLRKTDEWRAHRRATRPQRVGGRKSPAFTVAVSARNAARAASRRPTLVCQSARGSTRTTAEIAASLLVGKRINHSIENPSPLVLPEAELPIPPYTLGAWLGDGNSAGAIVHGIDEGVFDQIAADGFTVTRHNDPTGHGIIGLHRLLRVNGLFGNKHVPPEYLRASISQRLALLQGLCDTDGHAVAGKGSVEFTTTSPAIRDGFVELLATLGIKPSAREGRAKLDGRASGAKWRIQFLTALPAFRLTRKLERQKREGFRGNHARRFIVSARKVEPTPMRCISVDSPSRTYLASRRMVVTHNSEGLVIAPLRWVQIPSFRALILRRTFPELARDIIPLSWQHYPLAGGVYKASEKVWKFPSGAVIEFGHLEGENDVSKYQGLECQYLAFDELTSFTEKQYVYLLSRVRSNPGGAPIRVRAATNPGGIGHEWVMGRWAPWLDRRPQYDGPKAEPGAVLHYRNTDDAEEYTERGADTLSRVFIPARLVDNPHLDSGYANRLGGLDRVTRAQLRDGDWLATPAAGAYYHRGWFPILDVASAAAIVRVRRWDLASTENGGDWTVGVKMALHGDRSITVEDVVRVRMRPAGVEQTILKTAQLDGKGCHVFIPQDPGQAGKGQVEAYTKLLAGYVIRSKTETGDKVTRQEPFSAQCEAKNVSLIRGLWNEPFLQCLEGFPDAAHDDDVDAAAGAYSYLAERIPNLNYIAGATAMGQSLRAGK